MKNKYIIIPAIIIVILGIITAFTFLTKDKRNTENNVAEVSIPVETSTPEPTATPETTPDPLPESSIDYKDIDPSIHATYNESTGEITVDDTMTETMRSKCPYFQSYIMPKAVAQSILAEYLDGYYKGRFDDNAWLQFALTGDQEYLNLEVTDADLLIQNEQQVDEWLQTEEGQKTKAEVDAAKGTEEEQQERIYNTLAETMGLSVEEVKALMAESESSSSTSTSSGNTGGGSSQIATPSTNQSSANENNFVTPETNNGANNNSGSDARPGEITVDIWGNAAAAGDGGPLTGNVQLNP